MIQLARWYVQRSRAGPPLPSNNGRRGSCRSACWLRRTLCSTLPAHARPSRSPVPAGAICAAAAGRQLSAASAAAPAAAAASPGACIANPDHPFEAERPELGACKACDAPANTTCVECWPLFSLGDAGECVMVRAGEGMP